MLQRSPTGFASELPKPRRSGARRRQPDEDVNCDCHIVRSSGKPWMKRMASPSPWLERARVSPLVERRTETRETPLSSIAVILSLPASRKRRLGMRPSTDYLEHLARLARKVHADASVGGSAPQPDAEFYKVLAKAAEEVVQAFKSLSQRD